MFKEVQAAYDVLSDPEKRQQYDSWGSPSGRPEFGPGGSFTFDFGDFGDLGDLLGGIFGGRRGGMRAQSPRGRRGQRRGGRAQPLVRGRAARRGDDDSGQPRVGVLDVQGIGSEARDAAEDLPAVRRPRRRLGGAGAVRALAAVPALPRERHGDRGSLPDVPRHGPRAAHAPLQGEDPGRRQGRDAHPPARQGRGGLRRRARRRSLRRHARGAVEALPPPGRRRSRDRGSGHVSRRPRSARPSRCRRPTAASRSRCRPGRRTESSCASRVAACRSSRARGAATSSPGCA